MNKTKNFYLVSIKRESLIQIKKLKIFKKFYKKYKIYIICDL